MGEGLGRILSWQSAGHTSMRGPKVDQSDSILKTQASTVIHIHVVSHHWGGKNRKGNPGV